MVTGFLKIFHAFWNVFRTAKSPGVEISQKLKGDSTVPVYHLQKLSGKGIVLLGTISVGIAGTEVVCSPVIGGNPVIGPSEKLKGFGTILRHSSAEKV